MKTAVISDIHGNIFALESVLEDIRKQQCGKILCLGDLVMAGPEPLSTLSAIHDLLHSENFYIIQGNTDKMLSVFSFDTYNETLKVNDVMASAYLADSRLLPDEEKEFLKNLPEQMQIEVCGVKILMVHGSPRKNNENIFPGLDIETVEEMIKETDADIIFCGHTHTPCGYQTNTGKTVINVGSVGRPFTENPDACYVVLDINEENGSYTSEHRFVKYNVKEASEKVKERGFEGADRLAAMLLNPSTRYP